MPQGKGTYGSNVGRPPKKKFYKEGGPVAGRAATQKSKLAKLKEAAGKKPGKKDVNTPGEKKRAFKGMVDHMVSMSEGQFNKMIKNLRAKRR